jgi:CRP/FNR family transcriptional regulator
VQTEAATTVAVVSGRIYRGLFESERAIQDLTVRTLSTLVRQTQQEMAGQIGTTREVVARLTSRLAARGPIATGRGAVTILQSSVLAELAQSGEPGS